MTLQFVKPYIDTYDGELITYEEMLTKLTHRELRYNLKTKYGEDLQFLDLKKAYEIENDYPEMMHWAPNQDGGIPGSGKSATAQSIGQENTGIPGSYEDLPVDLEIPLPDINLSPEEIFYYIQDEESKITWTDYLGPSYWDIYTEGGLPSVGSWDGEKYIFTCYFTFGVDFPFVLKTTGTWANGYRPTKMRITATGCLLNYGFTVLDDISGHEILPATGAFYSQKVFDLTWNGYDDLQYITFPFAGVGSATITNIEFGE